MGAGAQGVIVITYSSTGIVQQYNPPFNLYGLQPLLAQ